MNQEHQHKIQHLYWRAGFGMSATDLAATASMSIMEVVKKLIVEGKVNKVLEVVEKDTYLALKSAKKDIKQNDVVPEPKAGRREMLKEVIKAQRAQLGELNEAWVSLMTEKEGVLREKMTLFWHGHFACRTKSPALMQRQNNTLRQHALGNFGELLLAVSKDAAMLQFLNNQQNRKQSPNENFAREVMELFTIGRGNYSEQDVKEAARAFTGWGFELTTGNYVFRPKFHDTGKKTIFDKTGNFKGEDVIEMLLKHPQMPIFICTKIYKYFVNERINEDLVNQMAKRFKTSNFDIADLMSYVFTANWFYDKSNQGAKIKSPVELLVGYQQTLGLRYGSQKPMIGTQKILGQVLFYPPNVAGWPGGQNWIDSTSLLVRMSLPKAIFQNISLDIAAKDNGDANEEQFRRKMSFESTMDWVAFSKNFDTIPTQKLTQTLSNFILQVPVPLQTLDIIEANAQSEDRIKFIKKVTIGLLSLPEYQVC
jgi:uncharacterized protein (DUF1800 family)